MAQSQKRDHTVVIIGTGFGGTMTAIPLAQKFTERNNIQPPDFVLDDERWPTSWAKDERDGYYNLARHAISFSVISALKARGLQQIPFTDTKMPPDPAINAGLSNIVARTARLNPHWDVVADPKSM